MDIEKEFDQMKSYLGNAVGWGRMEPQTKDDLEKSFKTYFALIKEQQEQIKHLERVNMMSIHIMTDKQNDKLISLLEKKAK